MQAGVDTLEKRRITNRTTSLSRKDIFQGDRVIGTIGGTRKADVTIKSNQLHSLDKKEFYNELCVQLKQGSFDVRNNFVSNLYGCLKNHPDYKGDLVFNNDMDVNGIVSLIQEKLIELMPNNTELSIDTECYGDDEMTITSYVSHDMLCNQLAMPLRWMLKLGRENPKLYTIVRNVISLVKGKFLISDFKDGFSEQAEEYFYSELLELEDKEDLKWYSKGYSEAMSKEALEYYAKCYEDKSKKIKKVDGKGYLLISEITDIYKHIDEDWLINQIAAYKPRKPLYKALLEWAKKGMELYYSHDDISIHDLIHVTPEEYECGQPVTALDFMKFEWDFRCPYWENGIELILNDYAGQVGVIDTRSHTVLKKDHFIDRSDERYEVFGKELEEWFDFGTDIYYKQIWEWEDR